MDAENVRRHVNGQILGAILFLTTVDTVDTIVSAENFRSEMCLQRVLQIHFSSGRYTQIDVFNVICFCGYRLTRITFDLALHFPFEYISSPSFLIAIFSETPGDLAGNF